MAKKKESKNVVDSEVARFLSIAINKSAKTQYDIATAIGYAKPNIITMIKQGRTKLPITKVKLMADALDIDPKILLQLCFEEYQPDNWTVIEDIFRS